MTVGKNGYDEGLAIAKVSYTHDSMIDHIMAEPDISHGKLAEIYEYTEGWVSRVIASDAFQARLAERKEQLVDPSIAKSMNERLEGMAVASLELVQQKLEQGDSAQYALEALGLATKALGYGARPQPAVRGRR